MPNSLTKTDVSVSTLAKPVPLTLMAARTAIRVSPELQAIFDTAHFEGWGAADLAERLLSKLPDFLVDPVDLRETCQYLADEFTQLGNHTLLISTETGKAIARIAEEDLYFPAPVSRENGIQARPLPRLRPDLEAALVQWTFDRARDRQTVQALAVRTPSSALLAQEGDPRLLLVTRDGRKYIVDRLREALPTLLQSVSGVGGELLKLCKFCTPEEVPEALDPSAPVVGRARVLMPVADPKTFNLRHDPLTSMRAKVGMQWARDIARTITGLTCNLSPYQAAEVDDLLPTRLWIANSDVTVALASAGKRVFPVDAASPTLVHQWQRSPIAYICIRPEAYECRSREFLDRWEVVAAFEFTIAIEPQAFTAYHFRNIAQSGLSVEVVS
jgi:hypothetical protein